MISNADPILATDTAIRQAGFIEFEQDLEAAKGEDLKSRIGPTAEEDADHGEDGENAFSHKMTL